jgi:hypothetical protein
MSQGGEKERERREVSVWGEHVRGGVYWTHDDSEILHLVKCGARGGGRGGKSARG